jgi:tRNA pseudouridine38-40 synthase
MVAHFETGAGECRMPPRKLALALNAWLPPDVRVLAAARAGRDFNARFDASGKQYRYFVWNHSAMNPLIRHTAWQVSRPLDLAAMRRAAAALRGRHDFQSFTSNPGYARESTVRTLSKCEIKRSGPLLTFVIEGDGFLYKMCRGIVGTLVQVGLGKFPAHEVSSMLARKDRRVAGMTAPAQGLVLWKVFYKKKKKNGVKHIASVTSGHAHRPG